ncbi:MAG: hypothetical protein ACLFM0_09575 [Spirochaetales bacterium]
MMAQRSVVLSVLIVLIGFPAHAYMSEPERSVILSTEYSIPLNPPAVEDVDEMPPGAEETLRFGLGYNFWGVFVASGHIYSDINYKADNVFGVGVRPLGMFSGGVGLDIPVGGPRILLDWQRLFTGPSAPNEGVISYAGQFKMGLGFDVTDRWGLSVFSRTIRNFSGRAKELGDYEKAFDLTDGRFTNIGVGAQIRF